MFFRKSVDKLVMFWRMRFSAFLKSVIYNFLLWSSVSRRYKSCAILMYHTISDKDVLYVVESEDFSWQMDFLKKNNFNVISLAELVDKLRNKKNIPDKTVVLTFDDGYEDNYLMAWPILRKYNFPATIFLATGRVGGIYKSQSQNVSFRMLSWSQIKEMHQSGLVDFEPHTVSHPKLVNFSIAGAEQEITISKLTIEEQLNKKCLFFAYPAGSYNQDVINILEKNDFIAAVTVKPGFIKSDDKLLELNRNFVYLYCSRPEFKAICGLSYKLIW